MAKVNKKALGWAFVVSLIIWGILIVYCILEIYFFSKFEDEI